MPEPAATDYAAQEANQFDWASQVTSRSSSTFRADLEADAGGNPSWNVGVNYFQDLAKSADYQEVVALYKAAGLSLTADVHTLQSAPRVAASPRAVRYLSRNIAFNGHISVPVLTMHTTGDGLVVPENEQAYQSVVDRAGRGNLLRQVFVHRAGHCAFTPAETITAVQVLLNRLHTGYWNVAEPSRHERPGHGARTGLQHLLGQQYAGRGDRARVHPVPAGPVPAPVRPALHPPVGPRLSPALPAPPVPPQHPHIERH